MDLPDPDRFSMSFRVSCRFGAMVLAMFQRALCQRPPREKLPRTWQVRTAAETVGICDGRVMVAVWWGCSGYRPLPARTRPRSKDPRYGEDDSLWRPWSQTSGVRSRRLFMVRLNRTLERLLSENIYLHSSEFIVTWFLTFKLISNWEPHRWFHSFQRIAVRDLHTTTPLWLSRVRWAHWSNNKASFWLADWSPNHGAHGNTSN